MKRNRILGMVFAVIMLLSISFTALADGYDVYYKGETVEFDVQPYVSDSGVLLIPMRFVFEAAGASVAFDDETSTVTAVFPETGIFVIAQLKNPRIFVNTEMIELETAPQILDDRTMVTVEFFEAVLSDCVINVEGNSVTITRAVPETVDDTKTEQADQADE